MIDNINLSITGVLVTIEDQTVTGHKSFVSNVIVQGDLHVDRYINDIDIVVLLTDTVGHSQVRGQTSFATDVIIQSNLR